MRTIDRQKSAKNDGHCTPKDGRTRSMKGGTVELMDASRRWSTASRSVRDSDTHDDRFRSVLCAVPGNLIEPDNGIKRAHGRKRHCIATMPMFFFSLKQPDQQYACRSVQNTTYRCRGLTMNICIAF